MKVEKLSSLLIHLGLLTLLICGCGHPVGHAQMPAQEVSKQMSKEKTNSEWGKILNPEEYHIMVEKGTEPPFQNSFYNNHKKGIYVSAATGEPLFSSEDKFDSGTGWPSFSRPIQEETVGVVSDMSHGMVRNEVVEKSTGLHLGHVFNDGPAPTNLRYCINSGALKFVAHDDTNGSSVSRLDTAYFASGCFWCLEAVYESVIGVEDVISGYSGGHTKNPTYEQSNTGKTGHAEAVQVIYNPSVVNFSQLIDVYFGSQDPTQFNGQGPDHGSQYRSIIFYKNQNEKEVIEEKKAALARQLNGNIAAEVTLFSKFWVAEDYHQDYEKLHPDNPYIRNVSIPRLDRFRQKYPALLKESRVP